MVALLLLGGMGQAHTSTPSIVALHAFVGDPLWGMDSNEGSLFGVMPDERTAMASTTKIMTLHLAAIAMDLGYVSANDAVTVSSLAASIGGSSMTDMNGTKLAAGEVVTLDTLARGMMYPSGNNAAWAIAEHVSRAIEQEEMSSQEAVDEFVEWMNDHATNMGLVDTHFTNPNGFDNPSTPNPDPSDLNHYTTARELAKLWAHAYAEHSYFRFVVGLDGTFTGIGTLPSGDTKTYSWSINPNYPGWDGSKGGGTTNCNGPNQACTIASATRMDRQVVVAEMQGNPGTETADLLDYGFSEIFHPDFRGQSDAWGSVLDHSVACMSLRRAASAVITPQHELKLVIWGVDDDTGDITKIGQAPPYRGYRGDFKKFDPKMIDGSASVRGTAPEDGTGSGPGRAGQQESPFKPILVDVDVLRLPSGHIITGDVQGGSAELTAWKVSLTGMPSIIDSGVKVGSARTISLAPIAGSMFLSASRWDNGSVVLKSWKLAETRSGLGLIELDTAHGSVWEGKVTEIAVAASGHADALTGKTSALTAARHADDGTLVVTKWRVDPSTGDIERTGGWSHSHKATKIAIAEVPMPSNEEEGEILPPTYFAISHRTAEGKLRIFYYRVGADGIGSEAGDSATINELVYTTGVVGLEPGGLVTVTRDNDGAAKLGVWETLTKNDGTLKPDQLAVHVSSEAKLFDACSLGTTRAAGDIVTAFIDSQNELRLKMFRIADEPT